MTRRPAQASPWSVARRTGASAVVVLGALMLTACGGDDAGGEAVVTTTTVEPEPTEPLDTAPDESIGDEIAFIEVSARMGVGDDALVVALAVDRPTLEEIEVTDPEDAAAWCTGSEEGLVDLDTVEVYLVRVEDPAVDAAMAGAERFHLRAENVVIAPETPVAASFELAVDGVTHVVADGELVLNETPTGGTFSGASDAGEVIEGAFLCG